MDDGVGIVIPAYRPKPDRLCNFIDAIWAERTPERLIIELDQPSGETLEHLTSTPAEIFVSGRRRGKGAAITAGFDRLNTPVLAFVDADGSTAPGPLGDIIQPVRSELTDVAVGSRRHPDAHVPVNQTRIRRQLGDLFPIIGRTFLPISLYDYQCGAKAMNRTTWETIRGELACPGFAWDIEMLSIANAAGFRIQEVPIRWADRPGSTVPPLRTGLEFTRGFLRAHHRAKCVTGNQWHRKLDRIIPRRTPLIERSSTASHELPQEWQ